MNTTEQNVEATIRTPFTVDSNNPGFVRGGWYDDMGGLLVGMQAQYVADALNAYAAFLNGLDPLTPEQVDDVVIERLKTKGDAFDFARATNLYLLEARDLGTCLGGNSITELLMDRTDWSPEKCKSMGDRIASDRALVDLLEKEGVPTAYPD